MRLLLTVGVLLIATPLFAVPAAELPASGRTVDKPATADERPSYVVLATRKPAWESTIAISPLNPRAAVAVAMQEVTKSVYRGQPFRSLDGGATWEYGGDLALVAPLNPASIWARYGDPVITVNREGVFYISTLLGFPASYPLSRSGVGVFRSVDNGATWEGPFVVTESRNTDPGFKTSDKEWIGTDNSGGRHDGNVYVAWLRASPGQQDVESMFARSTDGGRTWSTPVVLGKGGSGQMVVDANGVLHLLWLRGLDLVDSMSYDGGVTFEEPVIAVRQKSGTFVSLAADISQGPYRGNLYIVWATATRSGTQPPLSRSVAGAVMFVRSTNGGNTWSEPVALTDVALGNIAAFPSVACDAATGDLVVAWQDRRENPTSREFRLYATRSRDGGTTFAAARAITSPVSLDTAGFIGDYYGTAAQSGTALSIFSDALGKTAVAPITFEAPPPQRRRRAVRQ